MRGALLFLRPRAVRNGHGYDTAALAFGDPIEITPDGRFVGRTSAGEAFDATGTAQSQEIRIVLNWVEELKRLVPVK